MKAINICISIITVLSFTTCSEKEEPANQTGTIQVSYRIDRVEQKSGLISDTTITQKNPKQLILTVHDESGKAVLNGERFDLIKIGDAYYSKSILLNTGTFKLEEFMVVDSSDQAVYIAPKVGSGLANFIDQPLPLTFEVKKDTETKLMVQVIPATITDIINSDVVNQDNTKRIHFIKSDLGGCNNKTIENIEVGDERNDTVIINISNDTLNISVGLTYICCAPFNTTCSIKNDSIFISIIDTCPNPYQDCYCRCACYYTFDYFFNSLSNKNYYWQILLSDPREENDTIFDMGTIDVGE